MLGPGLLENPLTLCSELTELFCLRDTESRVPLRGVPTVLDMPEHFMLEPERFFRAGRHALAPVCDFSADVCNFDALCFPLGTEQALSRDLLTRQVAHCKSMDDARSELFFLQLYQL